jgi:hypothetical protein
MLKYFELVFLNTPSHDAGLELLLKKLLLHGKKSDFCEKALTLYHFYGSLHRETVKFVLKQLCPDMCQFLDSKEFIFTANVDSLKLNDKGERPEREYITDELLRGNVSANRLSLYRMNDCLKYVCVNSKYDMMNVRKIIEFCVVSELSLGTLREGIAMATIRSRESKN